jgi:hypothetical protein
MINAISTVIANAIVEIAVHILYPWFEQEPTIGHEDILLSYTKHGVDLSSGHGRNRDSHEYKMVSITTSMIHPRLFGSIISVYTQLYSIQPSIL